MFQDRAARRLAISAAATPSAITRAAAQVPAASFPEDEGAADKTKDGPP
jgi:hypothetical protein